MDDSKISSSHGQLSERLCQLYTGYELFHGSYHVTGQKGTGKLDGAAATIPGPATPELWQMHLDGTRGLG